jgi:flagellar basal body rod protein FlgB
MRKGNDAQARSRTVEVEGLPERPDGNNVNIDREGMCFLRRNSNTKWACS